MRVLLDECVPISVSTSRYGLALCTIHHSAYDVNSPGIGPDCGRTRFSHDAENPALDPCRHSLRPRQVRTEEAGEAPAEIGAPHPLRD